MFYITFQNSLGAKTGKNKQKKCRWLATLLGHVNKQNFKVHFKNLIFFFLLVLFCCDVGESELDLKARCVPSWVLYKKCINRSEN